MVALLVALLLQANAAPVQVGHQARLLDALGTPISASSTSVRVSLWTAEENGAESWFEVHPNVEVLDGYYALSLGSAASLDSSVFGASALWLQVQFDTNPPLPRVPIHTSPSAAYAHAAGTATAVSGGVVNATEVQINGTPVIDNTGAIVSGATLAGLPCGTNEIPLFGGSSWGCSPRDAHTHALSSMSGTLSASQMPTSSVALAAGSTMGGQPITTGTMYADADAVAAVASADDYVSNGGDTITGDLDIDGYLSSDNTWGISARTQGLMAMPEGDVYEAGGTVVFSSNVILMNPAAGSFMRVAAGSYTLPTWGYLYVDLPPVGTRTPVTPSVGTWTDSDRPYDHPDRYVLAQRRADDLIYLNMAVPAHSMTAPSRLVTRTSGSLGDQRNNSSKSTAGAWWSIPGRSLPFTKRYGDSLLKITYQDTFGTQGTAYQGCQWRILLDGAQVHIFSTADHDRGPGETSDWTMSASTQTAWYGSAGAGSHTITVQNRGDRGAWGAGTDECLMGWNTSTNFLSVEEIP